MASEDVTVLLVEDDPITRELFEMAFASAGYAVLSAESGEAALALMARPSGRVDWLVTDIRLPGVVDGWIVGAEFHLTHPLRPVLYVTADAAPSLAQAANSVFLRKPCDPREVVAALRAMSDKLTPIARAA
ncbi:MAG: response regulator [Methylobacteriaceae bacterium]|nr:response regulator [Methylobacteriaceae bacterium]